MLLPSVVHAHFDAFTHTKSVVGYGAGTSERNSEMEMPSQDERNHYPGNSIRPIEL